MTVRICKDASCLSLAFRQFDEFVHEYGYIICYLVTRGFGFSAGGNSSPERGDKHATKNRIESHGGLRLIHATMRVPTSGRNACAKPLDPRTGDALGAHTVRRAR